MKKKFYRSRKDKVIAGVCGGLSEYFDIDPVLVRIIFFLLIFFNGIGVLLYLLLMIITPQEPISIEPTDFSSETISKAESSVQLEEKPSQSSKTRQIFGVILLVIGTLFLLDNLLPFFDFELIIPIILILVGVYLLIQSKKSD